MIADMLVLIDRQIDGRYHSNGVHITDFGLPFCSRLPINDQPAYVPGTHAYLAPEILQNGEASISPRSDVWAVGCIGYELCLGRKLAANRALLEQHIRTGRLNPQTLEHLINSIPPRFGNEVRNIIRACLVWEHMRRCSAVQLRDYILQHGQV